MAGEFLWIIMFLGILTALLVITELLHKYFHWPTEQSRKFIHVAGGLLCLLLPRFFTTHWPVLILASIAFVLLLITYIRKMLPSVHQVKRNSVGSVLFPFPVYGCFLIATIKQNNIFFYLPISLLAIADTAAEIGGNRWGHLTRKFFNGQKTLAGSLSFLFAATVVVVFWMQFIYQYPFEYWALTGLAIILLSTIAECVTLHGWDNLSIPAVTLAALLLLQF